VAPPPPPPPERFVELKKLLFLKALERRNEFIVGQLFPGARFCIPLTAREDGRSIPYAEEQRKRNTVLKKKFKNRFNLGCLKDMNYIFFLIVWTKGNFCENKLRFFFSQSRAEE